MTPFDEGFAHFLKCAGFTDDVRNARREALGEETDFDMGVNALGTGLGLAYLPGNVDNTLGLRSLTSGSAAGKGLGAKIKDFYTGQRAPATAMEDFVTQANSGSLTPVQVQQLMADTARLTGPPSAARTKAVLSRAISELPTYAGRHPFLMGLGALGLAGTANSAYRLGKGIHERQQGPSLSWQEAALGAGALGALGAAGGGLYEANRRGMLPQVTIQMPPGAQENE
jgi:hypothetical protein